jgi:hypothetical protein
VGPGRSFCSGAGGRRDARLRATQLQQRRDSGSTASGCGGRGGGCGAVGHRMSLAKQTGGQARIVHMNVDC